MTQTTRSKHGFKIGFFTTIGSIFITACLNGAWGIYSLIDSMNQPLQFTYEIINGVQTIKIISPSINWNVLEINIPLLIFQVIVFLWVYMNEDIFPLTIGNKSP